MLSSASSIGNIIGQFYQASLLPNIQGGQPTGDVICGADRNVFTFKEMRAKTEYLQTIDNYFSMFGYKVNSLKVPNLTNRSNWNYIKTNDINIIASIPQEDLDTIKNMFDSGVTLWHKTNYFLDYSQTNN